MRESGPGARRLRPLLWALLALLVLAVAAPFVLKDRHGRPLLSPADLHVPKVKVPDLPGLPGRDEDAPITVYKWQDPEGAWHYSDRPPEPGAQVAAETLQVGTPTVAPEPSHAPAPEKEGKKPSGLLLQLPDVLDKARDARDTTDAQGADLGQRLDAAGAP